MYPSYSMTSCEPTASFSSYTNFRPGPRSGIPGESWSRLLPDHPIAAVLGRGWSRGTRGGVVRSHWIGSALACRHCLRTAREDRLGTQGIGRRVRRRDLGSIESRSCQPGTHISHIGSKKAPTPRFVQEQVGQPVCEHHRDLHSRQRVPSQLVTLTLARCTDRPQREPVSVT